MRREMRMKERKERTRSGKEPISSDNSVRVNVGEVL